MAEFFDAFYEKFLPDDVRIMSWCPTADLLLLVSPEDTISLYRTHPKASKIWSLKTVTRSIIKLVTWCPNGKEVVIGYEDGSVNRVNAAYHSPELVPCWTPNSDDLSPAPVTSLVWIHFEFTKKHMNIEGFDADAFDLESALPQLSQKVPAEPIPLIPTMKKRKIQLPLKPTQSVEKQTLLFIGNAKGQIQIILNGIFPIGSVNIHEDKLDPIVLNISVPDDISSVQVLTKSGKKDNNFVLHVVDINILEKMKEQILSISKIQTELNYLLDYTTLNLSVLERHHESYCKRTMKIATKAADYMEQENDQANAMPEVELTGTLAIGSVTENLRPYFEEFLTTQNIKIIDANVTFSYQNSLRLICEHILPACERMQLELSKLMGYSLWTQRYGDFLETDSVQSSIDHFSDLIARLHEFASDLNHLATTFQAFIKWITMITIKVSDDDSSVEAQNESSLCEDPELVLEFLNKDFIKDSLSEYFVPQTPKKANAETLSDLLTKAKQSYYKMLKKPSDTLSEQIVVTSKVFFVLKGILLDQQPRDNVISITTVSALNQSQNER
ncbi:hypothetical protein INT47_004308 [Mucor saturninus]|uniref:Anaphase-promoting complex subunit 4 n=1 Tax=Mucor saturninus TaxID=64648 RepID=A0A8H7RB88_9FUNG|nr:hypothetical protein INT47_004308 [Mucor saturninus]